MGLRNKITVNKKPRGKKNRLVQLMTTICWPLCQRFPCHEVQESVWGSSQDASRVLYALFNPSINLDFLLTALNI